MSAYQFFPNSLTIKEIILSSYSCYLPKAWQNALVFVEFAVNKLYAIF